MISTSMVCLQVNEEKIEASEAAAVDETAPTQVCTTRVAGPMSCILLPLFGVFIL